MIALYNSHTSYPYFFSWFHTALIIIIIHVQQQQQQQQYAHTSLFTIVDD